MATFEPAPEKANAIVCDLVNDHYPDLIEANIEIAIVFARPTILENGEKAGPAMVKDHKQILGKLKVFSEEDRAAGSADVKLTLDADEFERVEEQHDSVEALRGFLGEWLEGIIVLREESTSNRGQAKLKIRPFDYVLTGYRSAASRYGCHSLTKRLAREFHDTYGNLLFDFASDLAEEPRLPGVEPEEPRRRRRGAAAVAAANR
jgi:hypothetical protein